MTMARGRAEDVLETAVCAEAIRTGWFVRKIAWLGRRGAPDRVFIADGRTVWIEFKAPDGHVDPAQEMEHKRMRAAGAEVHVVRTVDAAQRILRRGDP